MHTEDPYCQTKILCSSFKIYSHSSNAFETPDRNWFRHIECLKTSAEQSPLYFDSSWGIWKRRWNSPALLKYPPWHLCLLLGWQDHGSCGIERQLEPLCNHVLTSPVRGLEILNTCYLSQWRMLVVITLSTSFRSKMCSDCSSPLPDDIEWMCPHLWCWHD